MAATTVLEAVAFGRAGSIPVPGTMTKLSRKREARAQLIGEAWAFSLLKDYAGPSKPFPKGLQNLIKFGPKFAASGVSLSVTWKVSKREEEIAENRCREVLELALFVAEKYKEEEQTCKE